MFYYLPIILTVISNVFYHIFLKSTPNSVNPIISLTATYATAMLATLIIYPFYPTHSSLVSNFKALNWASYALGLAIVGLECGFILAYRLGWPVNMAGVISNIAVSILLIPVGLLLFKETLSVTNVMGLIFCIVGLFLINYKS